MRNNGEQEKEADRWEGNVWCGGPVLVFLAAHYEQRVVREGECEDAELDTHSTATPSLIGTWLLCGECIIILNYLNQSSNSTVTVLYFYIHFQYEKGDKYIKSSLSVFDVVTRHGLYIATYAAHTMKNIDKPQQTKKILAIK